jgi:hypothetical protein
MTLRPRQEYITLGPISGNFQPTESAAPARRRRSTSKHEENEEDDLSDPT